ncbi:MAG: peroxiredoxin family protein [Mariniblastus sp.]
MRLRYLLALTMFVAPGCSQPSTAVSDTTRVQKPDAVAATQDPEQEKSKDETAKPDKEKAAAKAKPAVDEEKEKAVTKTEPAAPKKSAEETAAAAAVKAEMAKANKAKERLAAAKEKFAAMTKEFNAATKTFSAARRKVKTREEFDALMKTAPLQTMGDQYIEFAKEYKGTDESLNAIRKIAAGGSGEAKKEAMNMLLEFAQSDPDSAKAKSAFQLIARSGSGDAKSAAMKQMLATAKSDSDSAFNMLSTIAMAPGKDVSKTEAIESLMDLIKADPTSERSVDSLVKMAMLRTESEAKDASIDLLIQHHVNNPKMIPLMSTLSRGLPSEKNDKWLTTISENASGPVKANAVMNRIALVGSIQTYSTMLADADEDMRKNFPAEVQEFLKKERDENELEMLDKMLDGYVKENTALIAKAEKELFALRNLAIGKTAPEIVAKDLDGVEFKLSDYRGKVVLLDFWGDW